MDNAIKKEIIQQQYADDKTLSARINLHKKHSTNKQGVANWLWEQYNFPADCRILELGCGNGEQWENNAGLLPENCTVVLSDFSDGMVNIVKEKFSGHKAFSFQQMDIQDIPFENNTFDFVIANHMLYHVPDLTKGLSEVQRVLKPNGKFFATTFGSGGLMPFLHNAFKQFDSETKAFSQQYSFTLQTGFEILKKHFSDVKRIDFEDAFAITETKDLIDWIKSTKKMSSYPEEHLDSLYDYFEEIRKKDGAINIPKEVGLFISAENL